MTVKPQTPGEPDHAAPVQRWRPTQKWFFGFGGGLLATVALGALESLDDVEIAGPYGGLIALVVGYGISYLKSNGKPPVT